MRTCIGCRSAVPWSSLVRIARDEQGGLRLAPTGPGRGAWLCAGTVAGVPADKCVELAHRRQAFARAFRGSVTAEAVDVLRSTMQERARIEKGATAGGAARRD